MYRTLIRTQAVTLCTLSPVSDLVGVVGDSKFFVFIYNRSQEVQILLVQREHIESHGFPSQIHRGLSSNAYPGATHEHR